MNIRKRKANLIPFRKADGGFEVYLSLRSKTAEQFPDMWSFWGGATQDGESPEQAMLREVKEELNYRPAAFMFLGIYHDAAPNEKHIFYAEIGDDFEREIKIRESQGGKFFSRGEVVALRNIVPGDEKPLKDLFSILEKA